MQITSSVKEKEVKPTTFPAHFKSMHNKTVVLFFDEKHGVVVEAGNAMETVGEFRSSWPSPILSGNWSRVERTTIFED